MSPPPFHLGAPFPSTVRDVSGSLAGLSWRLPRTGDSEPGVWFCPAGDSDSAVVGGVAGVTYDVTLRFRGVVERKAYTGGTNDGGLWQIGGAPDNSGGTPARLTGPNLYKLEISDPPQSYYLNRSADGSTVAIVAIDYTKTVQMNAGATVTLTAESVAEIVAPHVGEFRELAHATSVAGVTDPPQPYLGQWINMDVVSVTPH